MPRLRNLVATVAMVCATGAQALQMDPQNPTCPAEPSWSTNRTMELTPVERGGQKILLAEGRVDQGLPGRLQEALEENPDVTEIWFSSPGGDALSGNDAGRLLRSSFPGIITRIPEGWTCFSACNFVFMGGQLRIIEPGGTFMVHMFTHSGNRAVRESLASGGDEARETIGAIEQSSAQLATEDNDFLIRMGVSRRLLTQVMYETAAVGDGEVRRCLSQDEAYEYNVANVRE
ncbi:MAG: hypothetical protein RLN87_07715 [Parasphingopyxis sp.]|uniref:COG3904 family protein n=1 Tax=Parasphingopyxis sp. TaxID=1920299 RepID=UPI00261100C5|nr:hypothetical protein [uncultured Parasphingopyxis sp.]